MAVPIPIDVTESPVPTIDPEIMLDDVVIPRLTFGDPVMLTAGTFVKEAPLIAGNVPVSFDAETVLIFASVTAPLSI